jgi:deazaflavin-dependent oxidoreductase (nitroreductase family)
MTEEYPDFDVNAFQRSIIAEFRAHQGKVGGMLEGSTLALLTTVGARSGKRRTTPLSYLHVDGQPIVVASAMGSDQHPAWYHNIRNNPEVTVETGTETYQAIAEVPAGQDRDRLFAEVVQQESGFADYQTSTSRVIPVIVLRRQEPEPERVWDRGLGDFLVESHDWLRTELRELLRQVDEIVAGEGAGLERPVPDLALQMRTRCLEFCAAMQQHHTGEDRGAFPMLADRFPELAPDLTRLGQEHQVVTNLRAQIEQLVDDYVPGDSDPIALRKNLTELTTRLEEHFEYEERTVVAALNMLGPAPNFD